MKRYGYHRTSTREQHLDRGIAEITAYCKQNQLELERIFTDQQTGKNINRPRYQVLKEDVLRSGDELIITEVDRLGRNKRDTLKELQYFRDHNIRVKILELPTTLMDISKLDNTMAQMLMETVNNMLIELYAAMAQAEIEKKEKRQREGIKA
jgi:DNA invertase Pin-like site-specific DNA recombinase